MTREEIIKQSANGNTNAEMFLRVFLEWAHWVDDVADEPEGSPVRNPEEIARVEAHWMIQLTSNPFFLAHKERLLPMILIGLNAWVDSNAMPPGTIQDVVKGIYHEVGALTALLTGGWAHLRHTTSKCREYDIEGPIDPALNVERSTFNVERSTEETREEGGANGLLR